MVRVKKYISFIARLGLAAIWLIAGGVKAFDSIGTENSVKSYQIISGRFITWVAIGLPIIEIILGFMLLFGIKVKIAAIFSIIMLIFFIVIIISAWVRHLEISCGCFGNNLIPGVRNYFLVIFRDLGFLVLAIWLLKYPKSVLSVKIR